MDSNYDSKKLRFFLEEIWDLFFYRKNVLYPFHIHETSGNRNFEIHGTSEWVNPRFAFQFHPSLPLRSVTFTRCIPIIPSRENKLFFRVIVESRKAKRNRELFSITITRGVDYVMNHTNYTLSVLLLPCTLRATLDIPSLYRHSRDCPRQPTLTPSSSSFSLFLFFSILLFFSPPASFALPRFTGSTREIR